MAGRQDFAIIRSGLLIDSRAHAAAAAYTAAGLAVETVALATVIGHVAMLGLWASRETDDGVLPGDGLIAMNMAIPCAPRSALETIRDALLGAELLRKTRRGIYLVGFSSCYEPILEKRKADAERKRATRSSLKTSDGRPADVHRTSGVRPHAPDRTGPDRTGPESPPPPETGGEPACAVEPEGEPEAAPMNGRALRPRDRERYAKVLEYVIRCGTGFRLPSGRSQHVALERRAELQAGHTDDRDIRERLDGEYAWVTREKLARFLESPGART